MMLEWDIIYTYKFQPFYLTKLLTTLLKQHYNKLNDGVIFWFYIAQYTVIYRLSKILLLYIFYL